MNNWRKGKGVLGGGEKILEGRGVPGGK